MVECKDRRIVIGRDATLLSINPCYAGLETQPYTEVVSANVRHIECTALLANSRAMHDLIKEFACWRILRGACLNVEAQAILPLTIPQQLVRFVVHHVLHCGPLKRGKDVILIRW